MAKWRRGDEPAETGEDRAARLAAYKSFLAVWNPAARSARERAERWDRWQAEALAAAAPLVGEESARFLVAGLAAVEEDRLAKAADGPRLGPSDLPPDDGFPGRAPISDPG